MNILTRTVLEVKIGDRFYKLECSPDSPAPEVNEALVQMVNYVNSIIERQKPQEIVSEECQSTSASEQPSQPN